MTVMAAGPEERKGTFVKTFLGHFMTRERFDDLRRSYEAQWQARLMVLGQDGASVFPDGLSAGDEERKLLQKLIEESVRWGEAPVDLFPDGSMVWVVPILVNTRLLGGVAAVISRTMLFPNDDGNPLYDVRDAAVNLLRLLEAENLTNAPFLEMRRHQYMSERRRAEAIHAYKANSPDFRAIYLREEPALMSAIRKGDREQARGVLNNILVVVHSQAGENLALIKSFFLEIITLMYRAAVEAGCDSRALLGNNYERFTELSGVESEEELVPWVHDILETLIDAIHSRQNASPLTLLRAALEYMRENLHEDISRDEVAKVAHLSPAHFSRIFKKEMKESFTEMLNRMRIDRSSELLAQSDRSLCMVALDCGFKDQSYFTKVFRRYMRETPREYRLRLAAARRRGG